MGRERDGCWLQAPVCDTTTAWPQTQPTRGLWGASGSGSGSAGAWRGTDSTARDPARRQSFGERKRR